MDLIKKARLCQRKGPKNPKLDDGPAELVFHGRDIYIIGDGQPQVEALAVKGEEIITLGPYKNIKSVIDSSTKVVDLKGKHCLWALLNATLSTTTKLCLTDICPVGDRSSFLMHDRN